MGRRLTLIVVDSAVLKWAIELGLPSTLLKHGRPTTHTHIASSLATLHQHPHPCPANGLLGAPQHLPSRRIRAPAVPNVRMGWDFGWIIIYSIRVT